MAENDRSRQGVPIETVVTELSDPPKEEMVIDQTESGVSDEQLYDTVKRMRVMALGLSMVGARTRDGLYSAWAYNATATAGIMMQLLRERNSPYLAVLAEEEAGDENRAGSKELPLH